MKKESHPWYPAPYEKADVSALQALRNGTATQEQQHRALEYIVGTLAGKNDLSYRPGGEEGRRDTDFSEGRRYVGLQISKLLNMNLSSIPNKEAKADKHEPQS